MDYLYKPSVFDWFTLGCESLSLNRLFTINLKVQNHE
ncbi:hypothetical protein A1232T_00532 [Psychrobacter piechaudii]|uniref:Uncharacterized protein n=1 Tax=Psychrobacter piechaudii TaxID=1945521 RepID=A0A1R4GIC5_9GAMM|nr:hypothetical protein A1232T_00532 [Psychrobacter piechaudii]